MRDIITVEVGETIGNSKAVHVSDEGFAYLAELPDRPAVGFCITGASSGLIQIFLNGATALPVEAIPGAYLYLDNATPGAITATKPEGTIQTIGRVLDGSDFSIEIQTEIQLSGAAMSFFI